MAAPVLVLDTSTLAVWLKVPGIEPGSIGGAIHDRAFVDGRLQEARSHGGAIIVPYSSVIEIGNHILNAGGQRYETAQRLQAVLLAASDGHDGWAVFTREAEFLDAAGLRELGSHFVEEAKRGKPKGAFGPLSIADLSIIRIARYFARQGRPVTILTTDQGLKTQEPAPASQTPARRR